MFSVLWVDVLVDVVHIVCASRCVVCSKFLKIPVRGVDVVQV